MSESDDGQEKTEEPTQKKRDDARADGKVTTSTEMFVFATLAMATMILMLGQWALRGATAHWGNGLIIESSQSLDTLMLERTAEALWWIVIAGVGLGLLMMATIVVAQAGMGGLNFAPKALGFKADKVNPLAGFKRMASMKSLVDLGKSVLKVVLLLGAAAIMLNPLLPALMNSVSLAPGDAVVLFGQALIQVLWGLLIGLLIIGALDLGWQIHSQTKSLKMSIQDIRDEMKEAEGSPEQKGQMRRRQMEAATRAGERKALADVPMATAIITNPTHFAVALMYDPQSKSAPTVVAMGKGPMAHEIRKRGRRAGVYLLEVPVLARALYFTGAIGREIPEQLFTAVAVILAHVWRLEQGQPEPLPDVEIPHELAVDEYGRPMKGTSDDT